MPDLQKSAKVARREIVRTQDVVFNRSKVPAGAHGKPELVCSGDGGKSGSAGCVYVRCKTGEDQYVARLSTANLPGIMDRLSSSFIAGDSQSTISTMEGENKNLGLWFGNKVSKKNHPVKSLITAVQGLVLLVPADEEQQGPPEELEAPGLPNPGLSDDQFLPRPRVLPQQVGLAEVMPGQAQNLPGSCTSRPRVQPQQKGAC